jgi:hypothetical protein
VLVILEGCDGAGKTTLAHELLGYLSVLYPHARNELFHRGPPESHPLDEYELPLIDYQPATEHNIVCDRWHLGEVVYPQVLGRSSQLTPAALWHMEAFLLRKGAIIVHVSARDSVLQQRLFERGDDLVHANQVHDIQLAYALAINRTLLRVTYPTTVQHIVEVAEEQEKTFASLNEFTTYVGPRFPSLLLLGDVRKVDRPELPSPAFMPYPSTSGSYLLQSLYALHDDSRTRNSIGLANACDVDDPVALWETLGEPLTVALGVNAFKKASANESMGARYVDHPQYVRRFQHRKHDEYAQHILENRVPSWK